MKRFRPTLHLAASALAVAALLAAPAAWAQDFTRYVALGDSLTAGFASGGLVGSAQQNSYPAILSRHLRPGAPFEQPTVSNPGIPALLELRSLSPLIIAPRSQGQGVPTNLTLPRPYDNLGVPGATVGDTVRTLNGGLHDVVLRNPNLGNTTALQQALLQQPTFVTLWIGNNDVLGAATSGIVIEGVTLTPVAQFEADYRTIVAAVRNSGADMAIATIPDVTTIPFVTTIPPVLVDPATSQPVLINGQPVPLIGPSGPLSLGDRVLLPASAALAQGIGIPQALGGTGLPLGNELVLNVAEQQAIGARVAAYNSIIRQAATDFGTALVDANTIFNEVASEGVELGGLEFGPAFLTGGIFSYDGVHPSTFGYAFVANEMVKAISGHFGSDLDQVDLFPFTIGPDPAAGLTAAEAKSARFAPQAARNLRRALGLPSIKELLRLAAQGGGPAGPGSGGNGGGGGAGGNGGGGGETPATPGTPVTPERPTPGGLGGPGGIGGQ